MREEGKWHQLIEKCQGGDKEAFEELYLLFKDQVYNIAYRMMGNTQDAMDVTQDTFVKLYGSIKKFNFKSSLSTWLYRVVINICLDRKREAIYAVGEYYDERLIPRTYESEKNNPRTVAINMELQQYIQRAIDSLPKRYRIVATLRELQGLSYKEIANILRCSVGTVRSQLHRARVMLKSKLLPIKKRYL